MKILVVRYSSMGDVLLITPCIRMLKMQLGATVHVLTKSAYLDLFESNVHVDKLFVHEETNLRDLIAESFDLVIDLQKNLRSILLRLRLRVDGLSYNKKTLTKWLYLFFGVNRLKSVHVVDSYIHSVADLGIKDDLLGLDINVPQGPSDTVMKKEGDRPLIVISMGGTYITKRIPIELIRGMSLKKECDYVLIGGTDASIDESQCPKDMTNLIGLTTLKESIQQIDQADVVITGDTGTMHIAAALQKPIIVVWGSTAKEFGFYPYYGKRSRIRFISIEQKELTCRPCSKYGRKNCPKGHMKCLKQLQSSDLDREIDLLMRSRADSTLDID